MTSDVTPRLITLGAGKRGERRGDEREVAVGKKRKRCRKKEEARDSGGCPSIIERGSPHGGHVARSNDVQLRCPFWTLVRDSRPDWQRTPAGLLHMYYMRLCSEKLLADIRGLCSPFSPSSSGQLRPTTLFLCLQRTLPESLCTWLVFARWQLSFRANATRYRLSPSTFLS